MPHFSSRYPSRCIKQILRLEIVCVLSVPLELAIEYRAYLAMLLPCFHPNTQTEIILAPNTYTMRKWLSPRVAESKEQRKRTSAKVRDKIAPKLETDLVWPGPMYFHTRAYKSIYVHTFMFPRPCVYFNPHLHPACLFFPASKQNCWYKRVVTRSTLKELFKQVRDSILPGFSHALQ